MRDRKLLKEIKRIAEISIVRGRGEVWERQEAVSMRQIRTLLRENFRDEGSEGKRVKKDAKTNAGKSRKK